MRTHVSGRDTSFPSLKPSLISELHRALMLLAMSFSVSDGAWEKRCILGS